MGELMTIAETSTPSCFSCGNYGYLQKKNPLVKMAWYCEIILTSTWKINRNIFSIKMTIWEALSNLYYKNKGFAIMQ